MFNKIFFVCFILGLVLLGIFLTRFSKTNDLLKEYNRYGLIQSDIHYEGVEKMWGEQGLIFYQVELPFLNVPNHADKMTFSVSDATTKLSLSNLHLNVKEAMQKIHGPQLSENLESYVPFSDFFHKLLTSLSVLGVDEFVGDISVNTVYSDLKTMSFTLEAEQENHPSLTMSGVIHVPVIGSRHLSDLWQGKLLSADVHIVDSSLLHKYINYAKSRKFSLPEGITKGYLKLKNLPRSLPKITDILR